MGIFFFYNNRKPRQYNYKPILFNQEEEDRQKKLQDRIDRVKREMGVLPEETNFEKKDFKSEFVSQTRHLKKRKERDEFGKQPFFARNGLLVILLIILFVVFYFFVFR